MAVGKRERTLVEELEQASFDYEFSLTSETKVDQALAKKRLEAARTAILEALALPEQTGWQPIESAPNRGDYLVYQPEYQHGRTTLRARVCMQSNAGGVRNSTHWMPLPTPPNAGLLKEDGE